VSAAPTRFFFELTPERVLEAVEAAGFRCTGRCQALNSFENRVYDVELEEEENGHSAPLPFAHAAARRRVVKFYRPGRWTPEQILEEHAFIADLVAAEVPAIAPVAFPDGSTLRQTPAGGIWYAVFPKVGGRAPDELGDDQLRWLGRLLGRIHNTGAARPARYRMPLTPATYGRANLAYLLDRDWIPIEFRLRYETAVNAICDRIEPWFDGVAQIRLHGDCHLGNLLWNDRGPFFLDFDDMVRGPAVQDLWLLLSGRDGGGRRELECLLEGYEELRAFDRATLRLVEPLRALRFVHYTAWIARRWEDPAFPAAFPQFGTHRYWSDEADDLEAQLRRIQAIEIPY
jgi:Ser/Thr protein kinase RdoA (MazF antagonist)